MDHEEGRPMDNFLLNISPYLFIASSIPGLIVMKFLFDHYRDDDGEDIKKLRNVLIVLLGACLLLMFVEIFIIFAVIYNVHLFKNDRLVLLVISLSILAATNWWSYFKIRKEII